MRVPSLGRRLAGSHAVGTGRTEIVGEVPEQVVCYSADIRLLRRIAQYGCHDAELPPRLLRVADPASELRPREGQLS